MKNILKTVAIITLFTIITRVSGFIFRIWMSREIGAEALGMYQIAFSMFIVLITLCCSGIPLTVSRLSAKYKALNLESSKYAMTTTALLIAGLSATFLCLVILIGNKLFAMLFTEQSCMLILLTMLPAVVFSAVHGVIRGYLWGENDYLSVCIIELIEQYVRIIACVIALSFAYSTLEGALSASWSLTIAIFTSCLCIVFVYKKKGGKFVKPKGHFKEVLASSTPITALRFISSLLMPLISIIIPIGLVNAGYTNEQALSLFGIAIGMAYPLLFLPTTLIDSLSIALIPSLSTSLAKKEFDSIKSQINNSFAFTSFIACLFIPIFSALGEPICIFLFDSALAGQFLAKASILIVPLAFNNLSSTMLNSLGFEKHTFVYFLSASALMLITLFIAPQFVGIDAIIYAVFVQVMITTLLNIRLMIKNNFVDKKTLKPLLSLFLLSIGTALIIYNIYQLLISFLPLFFALVISGCISCISFTLISQHLGLYNIKVFVVKFLKKRKSRT